MVNKKSGAWKSGWTIPNEVSTTTKVIGFILAVFGVLILWQVVLAGYDILYHLLGLMLVVVGIVGMADDKRPAILELLFGFLIIISALYMPAFSLMLLIMYFVALGLILLITSDSAIGKVVGILMWVAAGLFVVMPVWFPFTVGFSLILVGIYYFAEGARGL